MNLVKYITSKEYRLQIKRRRLLRDAIEEAKFLHNTTGRKYYVIDLGKGFMCVTMSMVNDMKSKGLLRKSFDFMSLDRIAEYVTKDQTKPR